MRKDEFALPLSPLPSPLDGLFAQCGAENDCNKCAVVKKCTALHDSYPTKGVFVWEANIKLLELRKKAGYLNTRGGKVFVIC